MKFLHTSDWHLGASDGEYSLYEDQKFFIDEICRIAKEQAVDGVLIAGDVYDRSVASAEAVSLYDYAMNKLCLQQNTPVMMIAGNHDSAERLASCSSLLSAAGLHIVGSLERQNKKVTLGDCDIWLLPWISVEKVRSVFPEKKEMISSMEDAYRVVCDNIRAEFQPGKKNIIVSHAFITKAETSTSDRSAVIGLATQVGASVFDGFDYVALGHIHKPQSVTENIRYCGTPMPYSFGSEETQVKGVTILDTDTMAVEHIELPLLHKRTTLTGSYEEILAANFDPEVVNGYVKLNMPDIFIGLETISTLRNVYPHIIEYAGKHYEGDNSSITMTMEEFEELESDPMEIFKHFCREEAGMDPDEHLKELFRNAIEATQEGAE